MPVHAAERVTRTEVAKASLTWLRLGLRLGLGLGPWLGLGLGLGLGFGL